MSRADKIIVGVGVVLVGYIVVGTYAMRWQAGRDAEIAAVAARDEAEAETMTQGMAAAGTILKRNGVAVAELWAMKEIGAVAGAVVDFTAHDAAHRYRVFQQGLREMTRVAIIGNHLPDTSLEWIGDLNEGTVQVYTVIFPDESEITFRGFLTRVGTHPPIEGQLIFHAEIQPVPIPPYWHCYAEGSGDTPPPDDKGHWEPVPPQEAPEWPAFGYDVAGTESAGAASFLVGTIFPYPSGAPPNSVTADGVWPTWPTPASFNIDETLPCYSIYCTYDPDENLALSIVAYVQYPESEGPPTDAMRAAIYKPDGTFVAGTETQVLTMGDPAAWVTFTFAEPPTLLPETNYVLLVWAQQPAGMDSSLWGNHLDDWVAPGGVIWVPDPPEPYPVCTIVFYED